ncbi:RNA polymerase sigma-70 factor [Chitinophaga oryzae]|uniref:RNA polymerase sigma-70 factor n=1 Tax=Chitinophaga oryzae TaxID=2725414 RepID=A0AAE7D676_9BACT|nr:RNA polymerase sigma-70 factor [Chitinophaga oryzae]QJB30387.1 RNA polymerase sigma-70 factor [Chitinophaga oryzae]QJB36897.1 RNA polymerase sigma-70 factor [Chitinophaga oryzae]
MSRSSIPDEREQLLAIAAGNEAAYTRMFNTYSQQVFNAAMLYLKDPAAAREVVQEIFMRVWLKREALNAIDDFSDYLFILTRNHIYDSFRKQQVKQKAMAYLGMQEPGYANDTDHVVQDHQYQQILHDAIDSLPPARKKIYLARKQGLSNEEISHQLNISVHTVKKQLQLALRSLRSIIKQQLNHFWIF